MQLVIKFVSLGKNGEELVRTVTRTVTPFPKNEPWNWYEAIAMAMYLKNKNERIISVSEGDGE